jgi:metal-responsive CopG/Arc/MetJ family transcriptional regulator
MGKNIRRVLVHIPKDFLEEFDREIMGLYASRNEAIRAGMIMVVESVKRRCSEK